MRYDFLPDNGNTVRRQLRLAGPIDIQAVCDRLRAIEAVKWLELKDQDLTVAYDFSCLDYSGLAGELAELGITIEETGLRRWRAAWYRFTDANARDNINHSPACCSKPPPGAGRK